MGPRSEGRTPIDVYPTYKLLKEQEDEWVKKGRVGVEWPRESGDARNEYTGPLTLPSYPPPYPTLPFSYRARRLKSFIPFQSLPSKVTVHDPWNLLAMSSPNNHLGPTVTNAPGRSDDWVSAKVDGKEVEDKIHSYKLKVIDDGMREMYEWYERIHPEQEWAVEELGRTMRGVEKGESGDRGEWRVTWVKEGEKEEDVKVYFKNAYIQLSTGFFPFLPSPSLSSSSPTTSSSPTPTAIPPPIYLIHYPPPPSLPLTLPRRQPNFSGIRPLGENTHVYFTPAKKAGDGHHSRAYKVEWVMPRGVVYPRGEDGLMRSGSDEGGEVGGKGEGEGEEEDGEVDYVLCKKCLLDDMWREIEVLRAGEASDVLRDELGTLTREEIPSSRSNSQSETAEEVDGEAGEREEAKEATEKKEIEKEEEEKPEVEEDRKEDDSDADKSEDSWVEVSSNDVVGSSPKATSPVLPTDTSTLSSDSSPSLPIVDSTPTEDDGKEKKEEKKRYLYTYTGPLRSITVKTLYQDRMRPKCVHRDPLHSVPPPTPTSSTIPSSQSESSEAESSDEGPRTIATITSSSSLPTPPAPVVPIPKVPEVSPTTTLRALAKLTYGPGYSPQCGHSGCSGSSSDHRRHMRREVWCYEWFGKDLRSGSDDDQDGSGRRGGEGGSGGKNGKGKGWKRGGKDKEVDMFLHWGKKPKMRVKAKPTTEEKGDEVKQEETKVEDKPAEEAIAEVVPALGEATNAEELNAAAPAPVDETKKDLDDAQPAAATTTEEEPKPAVVEEIANPADDDAQAPDVIPATNPNVTSNDPSTEVKVVTENVQLDELQGVPVPVESAPIVNPDAAKEDGEQGEVKGVEEPKPIVAEDAVVVKGEDAKEAKKEEVKEEEVKQEAAVEETKMEDETKDQEPKGNDEPKVDAEAPVAGAEEVGKEVEVKEEVVEVREEDAKEEPNANEEPALVEEVVKQETNDTAQPTDPPANPLVEVKEDTKEEAKEETALAKEAEVKQEATEAAQPTDPSPANPDTTNIDAPANPDIVDPPANAEPTPMVDSDPTNEPEVKPTDAPEPKVEPSPPTDPGPPPTDPPQPTITQKEAEEEELEYETDDDSSEGDIELGAILPRYYGYWVHDEECECRVVGLEAEVEEKREKVEGKEGEKKEEEEEAKEEVKVEDKEVEGLKKEDDTAKAEEVVEAKDEVKEDANPIIKDETAAGDTVNVEDPAPTKDDAPQPQPDLTTDITPTVPALDAEKVDAGKDEEEEDKDIVVVEAAKEVDEDIPKDAEATATEALPPPDTTAIEPPAEGVDAEAVVVEKTEVAEEKPSDDAKVEEAKVIDGSEETKNIPAEVPKVDAKPPNNDTNTALADIPPPDVTPDELSADKKLELGVPEEEAKKGEVVKEKKDEEKKDEVEEGKNEEMVEDKKDEEKKEDVAEEKKDEEKKDEVVEEQKDERVEEKKDEEKKDEVAEEKKEEVVEETKDEEEKDEVVEEKKEDPVEEKKEEVVEEKKEEVVEEKKDDEKKEAVVEEKKEEPKKKEKGYFSDILLLENCGWPVDNIRLRTDEKKQIHSLFSRFHSYGWTHHSPWKRNVVYHWGPVNKHMGHRKTDRDNRQLSFRVIDFGRARYHAGYDGKGTPGVDWDDKYEDADDRKAKWERATKSEMGDVRDEFVL